jgi:CRP/FNR family cyclic AMP-dependent transcriptional regulator
MPRQYFDRLPIFQDFTPDQCAQLVPLFKPVEFKQGDVLFKQGDPAVNLYMVVEGEVAVVYKPEDGPEIIVARVKSGGVVGWSAALGRPTYTSSVECTSECLMLQVISRDLGVLYERDPELGALVLERLAIVIAERLRNTHGQVLALLEQGLLFNSQKSIIDRVKSEVVST